MDVFFDYLLQHLWFFGSGLQNIKRKSFIVTKALRKATENNYWKLKVQSIAQIEVVQEKK